MIGLIMPWQNCMERMWSSSGTSIIRAAPSRLVGEKGRGVWVGCLFVCLFKSKEAWNIHTWILINSLFLLQLMTWKTKVYCNYLDFFVSNNLPTIHYPPTVLLRIILIASAALSIVVILFPSLSLSSSSSNLFNISWNIFNASSPSSNTDRDHNREETVLIWTPEVEEDHLSEVWCTL